MATFAIDLLTGKPYLFSGDFTNSGMTTFSGITTANNGLTCVSSHRVKLGGTLICSTVITRGIGNTAGIEYGGGATGGANTGDGGGGAWRHSGGAQSGGAGGSGIVIVQYTT
jgi:hypothetical protein